ncbi:hypothetical protein KJA14_01760 [Patescibacteria group bacterium]|nr:hypothetical protein [Patescibacteria group bacterium]
MNLKRKGPIMKMLERDYYDKILEKDYDHYDPEVYYCLYEIANQVLKVWQVQKRKKKKYKKEIKKI